MVMQFDSGNKLAKWSLATHEKKKNVKGELLDDVQWHNLIAWGSLATMVEDYVKKGMKLSIEGKLAYRRYTNKDGEEKQVTEKPETNKGCSCNGNWSALILAKILPDHGLSSQVH